MYHILQFMRVIYQVKQFFFSGMETPYIFYFTVSQGTPVIIRTIASGMFQVDVCTPCFPFHQTEQRLSVHVIRNCTTGSFQKSGK